MIAYKLFRHYKDGSIHSLFIDKTKNLPLKKWLTAKKHPTKGFKVRFGWHSLEIPFAPHLSKKNRAWYKIEIKNYTKLTRPKNHGGMWFLAKEMRILGKI